MLRRILQGKIHRCTVTGADLHYEGSVSIDPILLEASGIRPYEEVKIYNITNGERFDTYTILGEKGTGEIRINGAAAHKASEGDIVIICSYVLMDEREVETWKPNLVYVDGANRIKEIGPA